MPVCGVCRPTVGTYRGGRRPNGWCHPGVARRSTTVDAVGVWVCRPTVGTCRGVARSTNGGHVPGCGCADQRSAPTGAWRAGQQRSTPSRCGVCRPTIGTCRGVACSTNGGHVPGCGCADQRSAPTGVWRAGQQRSMPSRCGVCRPTIGTCRGAWEPVAPDRWSGGGAQRRDVRTPRSTKSSNSDADPSSRNHPRSCTHCR